MKEGKALMHCTKKKVNPCCQSGCPDCPYGYGEKANPNIPPEWLNNPSEENSEICHEIYQGEIPEEEEIKEC